MATPTIGISHVVAQDAAPGKAPSAERLHSWQDELAKLRGKGYITDDTRRRIRELDSLTGLLELHFTRSEYLFFKHAAEGAVVFPHERAPGVAVPPVEPPPANAVFPPELIAKLPGSIQELCEEFNFNYEHRKPNACMLLLRRILPLSIVRRFQQLNREADIRDHGELLETKALLGKAQPLLSTSRIYTDVMNAKLLIDGAQHVFTMRVSTTDVNGAAIAVRVFLEDLYKSAT